jgi:hypothetical protein
MRSPTTLEEAADVVAPILLAMLRQYPALSPELRKYYGDAIYWMIRKLPICAGKASPLAITEAARLGIPTLKNFWWEQQTKYDKARKVLHWEHVVPVGDIRDALIQLRPPTLEEVKALLMTYEIAWIGKEEDRLLKRSKRANPHEEYRRVGIHLQEL